MTGQVLANRKQLDILSGLTFFSKDPPLVHAGGEENGRLRDAHQQVGDGQVDDEDVGGRAQAAAPAEQKSPDVTWRHLSRSPAETKRTCVVHVDTSRWRRVLPAEGVYYQEVADHARDADSEDDGADGVVGVVRDISCGEGMHHRHLQDNARGDLDQTTS